MKLQNKTNQCNMQAQIIGDNPYGQIICGYFQRNFPSALKPNKDNILDIVTDIIVGNKELRHGPVPPPEVLVNIRNIIRDSIEKQLPIPILIPWGGRKTSPTALIDIAEVSAIHQIVTVDKMVKEFYPIGTQINIGIEDTGAMWLYRSNDIGIEQYSDSFYKLVIMLKGAANILPIRESMLMEKDKYFDLSSKYSDLLYETIMALEAFPNQNIEELKSYQALKAIGWKGTIDKAQRDYYIGRYKHLYNVEASEAARMAADYFGGAKARYDLKGKAEPISAVKGYIKGSFAHPIPGAATGMFDSTVYWRTIPTSQARTHIAPWRGKGYLKINKNEITTKIASWNDEKISQLVESQVELIEGSIKIDVQTDYLIEE
jgi:hypothetical protein